MATIRLNVRDQLFFLQVQRNVGHGAVDINAIARADAAEATGDVNGPADIVVAHFEVTGEAKADARAAASVTPVSSPVTATMRPTSRAA